MTPLSGQLKLIPCYYLHNAHFLVTDDWTYNYFYEPPTKQPLDIHKGNTLNSLAGNTAVPSPVVFAENK
jgi:hypothetical protein